MLIDSELEYLMRSFGSSFGSSFFDTPDDCIIVNDKIRIDLKGAKKENVSVSVDGNKITVLATKKNIHNKETKYEKVFILGSKYDSSKIKASYEDSILEISTELLETEKPRKITIA